eukprot:TRINITY_DN4258_c0_g1_i1.p1 TRINITY_DN4258_c0_g1~~TRINITY_DN4258_c0_g1_i1.p1  ORF type:complete len:563 (+),score=58.40 TRINITY_DN4258_c0_g1_i1:292-1980(+)
MCILGIELCERLTTLGIAVNLVTYLINTMHLPSAESANIVTNFLGTSFILCLLGGFLADTFLGRYLTIAIFASVQALGITILTIAATLPELSPPPCSNHHECKSATALQMAVLYIALYLIAMGTGGLKSSVSGFGADQFDESDEKEKSQMDSFFNRFFFCISIGSLLAVTVLVYIQDNAGRSWGYGICASCMLVAIMVFLGATKKYRFKKTGASGSPLTQIAQVLVASWRKRKLQFPPSPEMLYEEDKVVQSSKSRSVIHTQQFRFLDKAAIADKCEGSGQESRWKLCPKSKVEEVKTLIRMLPIWATTIMFWTIYAQMVTFSVEQASHMERKLGSFEIPAASLTVFFVGAILVTIALYDTTIMPLAKKWTKHPQGFTTLQKIGLGLLLSFLAMLAAAATEIKRLKVAKLNGLEKRPFSTVPLSVFYLIPQFLLVGAGEAFIYTGQLDFFIRESPAGMKALSTGLFLSTLALGFFFSSCLVSLVNRLTDPAWLPNNLNMARLDNFYWMVAILSFVNFIVYLFCAKWYTYKDDMIGKDAELVRMNGKGMVSDEKECIQVTIST